jgi:phage baseplate assembly protein W
MPVEIKHPFHLSEDGSVAVTKDPDDMVRQHVLSLVSTQPGERVMLPNYGVNSAQFLFEPDSSEIPIRLGTLIEDAFKEWEPGVTFLKAEVSPRTANEQENLERVEVEYARADSADSPTVVGSNTAIISAGGTVREVVRG